SRPDFRPLLHHQGAGEGVRNGAGRLQKRGGKPRRHPRMCLRRRKNGFHPEDPPVAAARKDDLMKHRLLLVEDDPLHRTMLFETLAEIGFGVTAAATGQEALEAITTAAFDVALVDIRLPDMDGFVLLDVLMQRQPECAVLLMTGQGTIEAAV